MYSILLYFTLLAYASLQTKQISNSAKQSRTQPRWRKTFIMWDLFIKRPLQDTFLLQ